MAKAGAGRRSGSESGWDAFARDAIRFASGVLALVIYALAAFLLIGIGSLIVGSVFSGSPVSVHRSVIDLAEVLAWPVVALLALFFTLVSRDLRYGAAALIRRVSRVRAGNYEVSFSSEVARRLKRDVEQSLSEFSDESRKEYDRAARTHRIRDLLREAVKDLRAASKVQGMPDAEGIQANRIMATVHVPDVVFEESLYQIVDYVPSGSGSGRRFSVRYGAIGHAWRSGNSSHYNTNDPQHSEDDLVAKWGMTRDEAQRYRKSGLAICLVLRDAQGKQTGLLFIAAEEVGAVTAKKDFEAQSKDLERLIRQFAGTDAHNSNLKRLGEALGKVYEEVAPAGTFMRVYR